MRRAAEVVQLDQDPSLARQRTRVEADPDCQRDERGAGDPGAPPQSTTRQREGLRSWVSEMSAAMTASTVMRSTTHAPAPIVMSVEMLPSDTL